LIGIAPFLVGGSLLLGILYYAFSNITLGFNFLTYLVLLLTFMISNTMYSSKKDVEGAVGFLIIVGIFIALIYFLGIKVPVPSWDMINDFGLVGFFQTGAILFGIPIAIDIAIILFAKIITKR
jgi:hypothetical protein